MSDDAIRARQAEINALHAEMFSAGAANGHRPVELDVRRSGPRYRRESPALDDAALIARAMTAANRAAFTALWKGKWKGRYRSASEADLALCSHLAFWTDRDVARMDRLFRASGLMREKWNSKRGETTYGRQTITRAVELCEDVYRPTPATATDGEPQRLNLVGGGDFLARPYPEPVPLIEGLLSDDGGGWLGGEEKTGKTWWALAEALALVFAKPVAGAFAVPRSRRVTIFEEEDSPRRTQRRLAALLRGMEIDPDDADVRTVLNDWLKIEVWAGFSLDDRGMLAQLRAHVADFRPAVVYIDCLRKVTLRDLNKAAEVSTLLAVLDDLRREHGVIFRLIHHYRKSQGFRSGRGSQEIGGSFILGAWAENSLFFEPIGRKQGAVKVEVQSKDGAPVPGFRLRLETEGPAHNPTVVRLTVESDDHASEAEETVYQAVASLPPTAALTGKPGVSIAAIIAATKKSDKTVRRALDALLATERCLVTGTMTKQAKLYAVIGQ